MIYNKQSSVKCLLSLMYDCIVQVDCYRLLMILIVYKLEGHKTSFLGPKNPVLILTTYVFLKKKVFLVESVKKVSKFNWNTYNLVINKLPFSQCNQSLCPNVVIKLDLRYLTVLENTSLNTLPSVVFIQSLNSEFLFTARSCEARLQSNEPIRSRPRSWCCSRRF